MRILKRKKFERNSQKGLLMVKVMEKLEIIATLQVNTEAQHIAYVI